MSLHEIDDLWQKTLSLIEQEMIRPTFETWIKVLQPVSYTNGSFVLGTSRQIVKEWVETRYLSLIRKSIEALLDHSVIISLSLIASDQTSVSSTNETLLSKAMSDSTISDSYAII